LVEIAAHPVLETKASVRIGELLQSNLKWERVLETASEHGTLALLKRNLQIVSGSGFERLPIHAHLLHLCRELAVRNLILTHALEAIVKALQAADIQVLVFKGPTLALFAFGDLASRQFNDLDLLVRPADYPRTLKVLADLGYRARKELSEEQLQRLVQTHGQILLAGKDSSLVEVHSRLIRKSFHFPLEFETLWERRQSITILKQSLDTFGVHDLLLYLAAHGAKHGWHNLGWVADFGHLLSRNSELDWHMLLKRAAAMRIETILLIAAMLARDLLATTLPPALQSACQNNRHAALLARDRSETIRGGKDHGGAAHDLWFGVRSRDHWRDSGTVLTTALFTSQESDYAAFHLPRSLFFLYPALRTVRLLSKYLGIRKRPADS